MVLYDSAEDILCKLAPEGYPEIFRTNQLLQFLHDQSCYFFHKSCEYIPDRYFTPEMDARVMMFKEALLLQGIHVTPVNSVDHSEKSLVAASQLIIDMQKYESVGLQYHAGDLEFLKSCHKKSLVTRYDYGCNDNAVYGIKLDVSEAVSRDPVVIFKDIHERPAVSRKSLHEFVDLYADAMHADQEFIAFIYPDGTAANMSDGYGDIDTDCMVSDDDVEAYIRYGIEKTEADAMVRELHDDPDRLFLFKLSILRIAVVIGTNTCILPKPLTPQQSVFLEGLQELGHIYVDTMNVVISDYIHDNAVFNGECRVPLQLSSGFMFGGSSSFYHYNWLSPEMKNEVESVMTITDDNVDDYLFDATLPGKIFVINSEATL